MQKSALFLLLCFVLCFACACSTVISDNGSNDNLDVKDNSSLTLDSASKASVDSVSSMPDSSSSESLAPIHSDLYIQKYTEQQIFDFFEEVVLNMEYSDGLGNTALVQKWNEPIRYRVEGIPTEQDLKVLNDLFLLLNQIEGFPGIFEAQNGPENLTISFLDLESFSNEYSDFLNGESAFGATQFWYYTDTNEIHTARIGYRIDISQDVRNSILIEEIINMLGISDTVLREDSVVYQYSDTNTVLSDVDLVVLKLLYNPNIKCGMDINACKKVVEALYF